MPELWRWPYEPEIDRHGVARVPIPVAVRPYVTRGYRVELVLPDGGTLQGVVENFNSIAWIARVRVERESNG